jgi:hypothetical protein
MSEGGDNDDMPREPPQGRDRRAVAHWPSGRSSFDGPCRSFPQVAVAMARAVSPMFAVADHAPVHVAAVPARAMFERGAGPRSPRASKCGELRAVARLGPRAVADYSGVSPSARLRVPGAWGRQARCAVRSDGADPTSGRCGPTALIRRVASAVRRRA